MVDQDLLYVRLGALALTVTEVGAQFEKPGLGTGCDWPKRRSDRVGSRRGPAVVVQQDVGDVVPVLGVVPPVGRGCLGYQEAPEPGHVDLDFAKDPAIIGAQRLLLDVPGCISGSAQVDSAQVLAVVESDDGALWL